MDLSKAVLGTFIALIAMTVYIEIINRLRSFVPAYISRKFTHLGAGLVYSMFLILLPIEYPLSPVIAVLSNVLFMGVFAFLAVGPPPKTTWNPRLLKLHTDLVKNMSVSVPPNRADLLKGPFHYTMMYLLTTLLFWIHSPAFAIVMGNVLFGDAMASVVGISFGKHKIKVWYKPDGKERYEKSWEGFFAFLIFGYLGSLFIAWYMNWMGAYGKIAFVFSDFAITALIPCIVCAFSELFCPPEVDNLVIPTAGMFVTYAMSMLGTANLIVPPSVFV